MEINAMTRHEKLEYLIETCSENFIKDGWFLRELVRWMEEDDFSEFFSQLCSNWNIENPEDKEEELIFTA